MPNRMPVPIETRTVKTTTRQSRPTITPFSPTRGRPAVLTDSSARMTTTPRTSPRAPPASDSRMLSVSNWRMIRPRLAPMADRMAISRFLPVARTSRRFATFAHAISKTKLTAPSRTISVCRTLLTKASWRGWTNTVRELAPKLLAGCLELCFGLLQCDPGFQPARRLKVMALIAGVRIELERHKDFGCRTEFTDIESRANDSNHNIGITAQGNGLTYDSRIARETSGPQTVADQGNLFTIGKILFFAECAASQNGRAEEFEIIGGYLPRPELLDKLAPRIVHDTNPESGAIFHGGL